LRSKSPWAWVPSLYFAEGLPYVLANTVSVILYKDLGVSNAEIALYTSWLYLPWVIKPLWSPVVDVLRTRRWWVLATQACMALALASTALFLPMPRFFMPTLLVFALLAFSSATHDIAADGFYMLGLDEGNQSAFVGVRATFYRVAMVAGEGGLVVVAGLLESRLGSSPPRAWSMTFFAAAALMALLWAWHGFTLPRPAADAAAHAQSPAEALRRFLDVFATFFKKKDIVRILAFLLFYRFAEAQLMKLISPFLLDAREKGGLGLANEQLGLAKGTVGVVSLLLGGLLGGYVISRGGLKRWLLIMVCAIHLPDAVFVFLSQVQPQSFALINVAIAFEQFGYGFGFTAYSLYMILVSDGPYKTAHFAICTGFMALGMMLPGMVSGWIQEHLGYQHFFIWVLASTIPGFAVALLVKVPGEFGRKAR
jgi:PAT family beta-lactamase induction signal transducer AmpG